MFRSSQKNRRRRSPEQRRRDRREKLGRWIRRGSYTVALGAVAIGLPLLSMWGYGAVMESERFSLTYVDVEGLHYLDEEALLEAADPVGGEHLLNIQSDQIEATLEALPFIDDVKVRRRFPDRLYIAIEEHEPVAIMVDEGFWLIDDRGRPFVELDAARPHIDLWDLPMVSGLSRAQVETEEGRQQIANALEVYEVYEQLGLAEEYPISEVYVDELMGISLLVGEEAVEIRLGHDRWPERLERLERIQASLIEQNINPSYVLIDHESEIDRVAVGQQSEPRSGPTVIDP